MKLCFSSVPYECPVIEGCCTSGANEKVACVNGSHPLNLWGFKWLFPAGVLPAVPHGTGPHSSLFYQGERKTFPDFTQLLTCGALKKCCMASQMALSWHSWRICSLHSWQVLGQPPWLPIRSTYSANFFTSVIWKTWSLLLFWYWISHEKTKMFTVFSLTLQTKKLSAGMKFLFITLTFISQPLWARMNKAWPLTLTNGWSTGASDTWTMSHNTEPSSKVYAPSVQAQRVYIPEREGLVG